MKRILIAVCWLSGACERLFRDACRAGREPARVRSSGRRGEASRSRRPGAGGGAHISVPAGKSSADGREPGLPRRHVAGRDVLPVDLETTVGSDISRVEQPVSGRLRRAVTVGGVEVLPAGTVGERPRDGRRSVPAR